MKLVIISGRSGSGKSSALNVLEDTGFYCIDNLPAGLLPALVAQYKQDSADSKRLAICIDARNHTKDIAALTSVIQQLPKEVSTQVVYLDANAPTLIKRFSETRRKHPLSDENTSLKQAIDQERIVLEPIAAIADLHINTNQMSVHDLRSMIKKRLCNDLHGENMSILFMSFGFKGGIPVDADIVYDVRCLPNPYWEAELREFTGQQAPVQKFLAQQQDVQEMFDDISHYLTRWLPRFERNNRSYVTIAIGCTGGKHRSVYLSERLSTYFHQHYKNTQVHHRELNRLS
ncbi:MAG: RNase adapter RapZ [Pseudomonadales bacterium]|nr:RNase adapter RapZ [Pseudomonadales bacterium]